MLTVEQLLQPRYRVIADYPFSPYKVGDIIEPYEGHFPVLNIPGHDLLGRIKTTQYGLPITEAEKYPHLFQRCHWSDNRTKEEFPEYVVFQSSKNHQRAYKIATCECDHNNIVVKIRCEGEDTFHNPDIYDRPATREEYEAYKSKNQ